MESGTARREIIKMDTDVGGNAMIERQIYQHEASVKLSENCKFLLDDADNKTKMTTLEAMREYMAENSIVITSENIPISRRKKGAIYLIVKAEPTVLGSDSIKMNQALGYRVV